MLIHNGDTKAQGDRIFVCSDSLANLRLRWRQACAHGVPARHCSGASTAVSVGLAVSLTLCHALTRAPRRQARQRVAAQPARLTGRKHNTTMVCCTSPSDRHAWRGLALPLKVLLWRALLSPPLADNPACNLCIDLIYIFSHHRTRRLRAGPSCLSGSACGALMALHRARSLPLRQLALLRHAGGTLPVCLEVAAAAAASGGSPACLPCNPAAPAAAQLWRLDSPLLRHLSSSAAVAALQAADAAGASDTAAGRALPQYGQLHARVAAGSEPLALPLGEQAHFDALLRNFQLSGSVKDQALALYVNSKVRCVYSKARWLLAPWCGGGHSADGRGRRRGVPCMLP